jgi:hypothetical protein
MLAKHVTVLVRRDMAEVIPATVFEHEVEVLKDVHGEGAIELVEGQQDFASVEIDTGEEFDRLKARYGMNDAGQFFAERVFGHSHRGLEAFAHKPAKQAKAAADKPAKQAEGE